MKNKVVFFLIIIFGLFFLFSGVIKIIDIDDFLFLMRQYRIKPFIYLAPVIPVIEIVLGYLLLFRIKTKQTILFSFILLIGFTFIFSYGHFIYKIDDCGCFGGVDYLKMSPFIFYLRNGLLLVLTYYLYSSLENENKHIKFIHYSGIIVIILLTTTSFWNKIEFKKYIEKTPYTRSTINEYHNNFINKNVNETIFKDYIETSKDSSYLLFIFSFDCPHCLASTVNLKSYVKNHAIDKILALASGSRAEERFFNENFPNNFKYQKIKHIDMHQITGFHPLSFYIKNDTIQFKVKGSLPKYDEFIDQYLLN